MNFATYALTVLSNFLVIYLIPDLKINGFLEIYTASSLAIGIMTVYCFSQDKLANTLKKVRLPICLALLATSLLFTSDRSIAIEYSAALLLSDYYITQSREKLQILVYRWLLILTLAPPLFGWHNYNEHILSVRMYCALLMLLSLSLSDATITTLKIKSPLLYVAATHALYFGSLGIISWSVPADKVRVWYVCAQIGQGIILKLLDYKIRTILTHKKAFHFLIYSTSVAFAPFLAIYYWSTIGLLAYLTSVIILALTPHWAGIK
jgi:hypothetical protein